MVDKAVHLHIGDKVRLKKPHPCGSAIWEILRVGADIRIKCEGCGRVVMLSRFDLIKDIREVFVAAPDGEGDGRGV